MILGRLGKGYCKKIGCQNFWPRKKGIFDVAIDGLLGSGIEGVLEGAPRDAINNLYKDAQEATVTCECKQNFVNILIFQLLLFMFNFSKMQVINRGSAG